MKFSERIIEEPLQLEQDGGYHPPKLTAIVMGIVVLLVCSAFWALAIYGAVQLWNRR